jgi:mRNA-degrading endonuclease RelE of RelBE toxin-antitoxin system
LLLGAGARRALSEQLPESVAVAVWEFLTGPLVENPRRVGHELIADLAGLWSARRGDYRVVYAIDEAERVVQVLRIAHRRDAYH